MIVAVPEQETTTASGIGIPEYSTVLTWYRFWCTECRLLADVSCSHASGALEQGDHHLTTVHGYSFPRPFPARAADWIYEHVLTRRYLESVGAIAWTGARENRRDEGEGAALVRCCPCQYGACGYCSQLGKHDRCTSRTSPPVVSQVLTYIVASDKAAVAPVWTTGRPCSWRCPCGCAPAEPAPEVEPVAAPPVVGEQLELFALAGGAR